MSNVIDIELLQKREELREEIGVLKDEIDILNIFLKKLKHEYFEIDNKICGKSVLRLR
jgi:hypothetical protein